MSALRLPTIDGVVPVDEFDDDEVSFPIDLPPMDKETLLYIERVRYESRQAVANAEARTAEKIAQYLETREYNLHPHVAGEKVRSLEWDR